MKNINQKSFEFDTFYCFDNQTHTLETIASAPLDIEEIRVISLFFGDNVKKHPLILRIIKSFNNRVIFMQRKSENKIVCHLYIQDKELNFFVNDVISKTHCDYLIWPKGEQKPPKLMVFDMDSTFIQIEVIDELAKYHQVGEKVSKITESAMRGELDFSESLKTRVACLKGLKSSTIDEIANELPLSKGINALVEWTLINDIKIAIVSGGFTPFVEKLKATMNLYRVKANTLEVFNYELTGNVLGKIVDAQAKADFVNELKSELNLNKSEIMSVGDGANDLLMMQETGFSLAYNAKPAVNEKAKGRMKNTSLDYLINVFDSLPKNNKTK